MNHCKEENKTPEVSISDEIVQQSNITSKEEIKEVSENRESKIYNLRILRYEV